MNPYILMLQADQDDQYFTESTLAELDASLSVKYLGSVDDLTNFVHKNGEPTLILLNDEGTITERGQTLRLLKANPHYNHIPVVVLGERSSRDYVRECYRAGASTFITKPTSINATQKKIQTFFSYWLEVAEV